MRLLPVVLAIMLIPPGANAALAPNYQRAKEMTAIIEAVASKMPEHPITKVIYQKPNEYHVVAGPCSIRASVVPLPAKTGLVGPNRFEVKLGVPRCKR